jgi:hypothetical protein
VTSFLLLEGVAWNSHWCDPVFCFTVLLGSDTGQAIMPNLDLSSILFWSSTATGIAVIAYSFVLAREWFRHWHPSGKGMFGRSRVAETSLNAHIASQWTEGRLRLDSVLALIKSLADLLEKEVKALRRLDHSNPQYEGEVRQMVGPTLRCFTFDKHLRDLAQSQGLDMTEKLLVLDQIQAAIESADLH